MEKKVLLIGLGVSGRASAELLLHHGKIPIAIDKQASIESDPRVQSLISKGLKFVTEIYREGLKNREELLRKHEKDPDGSFAVRSRRPEFESAEADKLKKFIAVEDTKKANDLAFLCETGGSQSLWLSDAGRTDSSITSGISWNEIEQVIISPGVPLTDPQVQKAIDLGIEVIGEIELAFRSLSNRCIGVTGTNGKTTTVLLTEHVLQKSGRKAKALGNIGATLSAYALAPDPEEILIVELSSFQLETLQKKCLETSLILNITPDHLDRYESIEEYASTKAKIELCTKGKLWISDQVAHDFGHLFKAPVYFEAIDPCQEVATISAMRYIQLGVPEKQNIQAAFALCSTFGVTDAEFRRALKTFRKPAHRIEYVGEWNGFTFYNDSKATNIDSVVHAIHLFEEQVILLAGGMNKGTSYKPWIDAFRTKVKRIVAFGQAAKKMESELKMNIPITCVETMEDALIFAVREAEVPMNIILSPGCSSFDQFSNYEHRGNEFKRIVEEKVWIEKKRS